MNSIYKIKNILFPTILLFVIFHSANAQQNLLSGTITDSTGASIAGANVSALNTENNTEIQIKSDTQGKYTFVGLLKGNYRLIVSAKGFNESIQEITFSGEMQIANFQLTVSPIAAIVTIETETSKIELEKVPGSTELISRKGIQQTLASNFKDILNFTPGILAQPRYGSDDMQFSVRGSGLRNNYHSRGINILINNLPYGDADGFSDFESLEFLTAQRVEVWKGANALRYGGNSAGGAINLVTETGETAFPLEIRLQGGSFGAMKAYLSTGGTRGKFGYFLGISDSELTGYREHNQQGRRRLFSNFTFQYDENTDIYADIVYANIAEKLPGSLSFADYKKTPQTANPENVVNDWGRFVDYARGAFGIKHRFGNRHEISLNLSAQYRNLVHPIFQVLDQDTRTFSGEVRYAYTGIKNRFVAGFAPQITLNGERRFENLAGVKGAQTAHFNSRAVNYGVYFENQHDFSRNFTFVAGGRIDYAKRRFTDLFLVDGDKSDKRNYKIFSPKIGFVWRRQENAQIFANVSRSYEPPLLGELTSFGAPGFLPLKAQDSWQTEIGTRGRFLNRRFDYEFAFFNAEIRNELINQNLLPFPGAPFTIPSFRNAEKTRHTGFELSTNAVLAKNLFTENSEISWRTAYTFSNFKFTRDINFSDNFIPGQPKHLLRSEVRYDHPKNFWIAPNIDWSPAAYFIDSANNFRNDSYAVFNVKAGFDHRKFGVFFEANNLMNRIYSASVQVDSGNGKFFEAANGRSAYIGIYYRLGRK